MIFLDTGYLVAIMDARDALHGRAVRWSRELHDPVLVTEYVLLETLNYFSKPVHRVRANGLVEQMRADPRCEVIHVDAALLDAGLRLHRERPDKFWSLTDCVSFVVMSGRGVTRALAYDDHFQQAGFQALLRNDPA